MKPWTISMDMLDYWTTGKSYVLRLVTQTKAPYLMVKIIAMAFRLIPACRMRNCAWRSSNPMGFLGSKGENSVFKGVVLTVWEMSGNEKWL